MSRSEEDDDLDPTGVPADLDALLDQELPRLRAFVRLRMGAQLRTLESASDLVQTVCLELLRQRERFEWRGRASFRHWLFVTALNKIRQRLSRRRIRQRVGVPWSEVDRLRLSECYGRIAQPQQALLDKEGVERLEATFDALPEHYAEVITLRCIVGMSFESLAAELGSTQPAVRMLLHRALARLATLLDRRPD